MEKINKNYENLKILFNSKNYKNLLEKTTKLLKEFQLPPQKQDRFSNITPYNLDFTEKYFTPNYVNISIVECLIKNDGSCNLISEFEFEKTKKLKTKEFLKIFKFFCFSLPLKEFSEDFSSSTEKTEMKLIVSLIDVEKTLNGVDYLKTYNKVLKREIDGVLVEFFINKKEKKQIETFENKTDEEILKLIIKTNQTEYKCVTRISTTRWPDHSVPTVKDFNILYSFFKYFSQNLGSEIVGVHCKAGVGRTGTFIAINILEELSLIRKIVRDDVFEVFLYLRAQRNFMIEVESQFVFVLNYFGFQ